MTRATKPYRPCVQHLQDQALGALVGILADQTGGGLTHETGTLGGAHAAQTHRQRRTQNGETHAADGVQKIIHINYPPS